MVKKQVVGIALIGVSVIALIAVLAIFLRTRPQDDLALDRRKDARPTRDQMIDVGGVKRPITDIRPGRARTDAKGDKSMDIDIGTTPKVPVDANPQVKSVVEALKTGKHPERVSSLITPKPFDQAAYLADSNAYLNVVEPGRIWQVAQPGKGVPRLTYLVE